MARGEPRATECHVDLLRAAVGRATGAAGPGLRVAAVALTLYGYCVQRTSPWERGREAVFALRRPSLWRRLLRPYPLLALTIEAGDGPPRAGVGPGGRTAYAGARAHCVRLDPELGERLVRVHREQVRAASRIRRLARWIARGKPDAHPAFFMAPRHARLTKDQTTAAELDSLVYALPARPETDTKWGVTPN